MARNPRDLADYMYRERKSLTALAGELGLSVSFLCDVKARRRTPRLELAIKIADYCRVPIRSLLGETSTRGNERA